MKMRIWIAGALGKVPSGFPGQVEVPQPFFHGMDTSFWLWVVRAALAAGIAVCLLYGSPVEGGRPGRRSRQEHPSAEQPDEEKEKE